jgi:translation initiation factor 1 (eIF-1/SUI1)
VGTGDELKALANSVIDSYEMRVRTVNGLMEQAYGFLRSFQMELEEMIERLRDNLAKGESLRKADFDRMMADLSESRLSHQLIAEDVLSRFQKEEMEMIDRLRKIVISGGRSNLKDMESIRDDILRRQKERETGVIRALKRVQVEQEELKAAIKRLLSKGEDVKISDFKRMITSLRIQQGDREIQLSRMLEDLDLARSRVQSQWQAVVSCH